MANKTTNYGLTKPLPEEFYDVGVQNTNMDIIDEKMKELENNVPEDVATKDDVNAAQTTANNAIITANSAFNGLATKAPMYTYSTEDLEAGVSPLETGTLYFVYE